MSGLTAPPARALLRPVLGWLVAGVVVGALWALLTPMAGDRAESYEQLVAGDVTLAVLGLVSGAGTAAVGLWRHRGPGAATRFGWALLGSGGASLVSWGTGLVCGAPALTIPGVLVLWPFSLAVVTVLVALVATLTSRDTY